MSLVVSAALCAVVGGPLGCGSTPKHAEMVSATANAPASPLVDRDKCNDKDKHVVTADINQDKKPDVWKFFKTVEIGGQKTEVMTCKQTDLNLDGKIDMVNYYDDTGSQIVLEEIDGDLDGKFDMTVYYNQGKRVRDEIDTNFDQRADVWKYYEDGKLVRIEFDKNNDGKVDEWDYYEAGKLDRIGYDTSGSGRVDRWDRAPEQEEEVARRQRDACRARWRRRAGARRRRDDTAARWRRAAPAGEAGGCAGGEAGRCACCEAAGEEVARRGRALARLALTPTLSRKRERETFAALDPDPVPSPREAGRG